MLRAVVAALAATAVLAGCNKHADTGILFKDPKGTIAIERGMVFTVELSVNASVGYDWEVVDPSLLKSAKLIGTEVDYPDEDRAGDSGVKRFKFRASKTAGHDTVLFRKLFRGDQQEKRSIVLEIR